MTTREEIGLGSTANDGTGDSLRTAGGKINRNFEKIFLLLGGDSDTIAGNITMDSDGIIYTGASFATELQYVQPTAARLVKIPDADGSILLDSAAQIIKNKQIEHPIIIDSSANEILQFSAIASAVNEVTIQNAATTGNPKIEATGDDTNITLDVDAKGNGAVKVSKLSVASNVYSAGTIDLTSGYTIFDSATAFGVSLTNGSKRGEQIILTNRGAGVVTVTPTSFAQGTSFAMRQITSACSLIWDSASWYIFSTNHDSDITVT